MNAETRPAAPPGGPFHAKAGRRGEDALRRCGEALLRATDLLADALEDILGPEQPNPAQKPDRRPAARTKARP